MRGSNSIKLRDVGLIVPWAGQILLLLEEILATGYVKLLFHPCVEFMGFSDDGTELCPLHYDILQRFQMVIRCGSRAQLAYAFVRDHCLSSVGAEPIKEIISPEEETSRI